MIANGANASSEPESEETVGQIVSRLVEDGRTYAKAELTLWQAIAAQRAKSLALPAGLAFAALLFLQGAVTTLCVAVFLALLTVMPALFAGILAFVIALAIAGGLAWLAYARVRKALR